MVFYLNDKELEEKITLTKDDLENASSTGYHKTIKIPDLYKEPNNKAAISIKLENKFYNKIAVETNLKTTIINY